MKKMKFVMLLLLVVSLLFAACNGTKCVSTCPDCGKCNDEVCTGPKCTCADQENTLCTLSGLTGDGYRFTAEGFDITATGQLQAAAGTELSLKLVLDESYCGGDPVVRLDGEVLTLAGETYPLTLRADGNLTLEGARFYQLIGKNPFSLKAEGTVDEVADPISESSSIITAPWQKEGYRLVSTDLAPYYSVMFYVRADNAWFALRDGLGQFNKKNADIYANGLKNAESGEMEPDSVWHKIEWIRQTDEDGTVSYMLYVDGQKHTHYDENTPVDPRLAENLNEWILDLNGTYYVSELFGCKDPKYEAEYVEYYIAEQEVFDLEADGLLTEDYPCEESVRYNLYYHPQWSQEQPVNFPLEPYQNTKFYINSPGSGFVVCKLGDEDVHMVAPGSGWHEYMLEYNGTDYSLYVDGENTGKTVRSNLRELLFLLNEATYYISELFVIDDPNFDGVIDEPYYQDPDYVPPQYVNVTKGDPIGVGAETSEIGPDAYFVTGSYQFTPAQWTKASLPSLDVLSYKELRFFVKAAGQEDKWLSMNKGDQMLLAVRDTAWHEIRLKKADGMMNVYVDGTLKSFISDLSQLELVFNEGAAYSYTDIYGLPDETYIPVTVTVTAPAGCTVEFRKHQANGNQIRVEKGTALHFEVKVAEGYEGTPVVKANGEQLTGVYGVYTYIAEKDTAITVP